MGQISKSPKLFIAVLEGREKTISRFSPGRAEIDWKKPTVTFKKYPVQPSP